MAVLTWAQAWQLALYARGTGFYRSTAGPAGHFTTASHGVLGDVLAKAVLALVDRNGLRRVVDIGCGRGELLAAVHALDPGLALVGVDVVPRPAGLPDAVTWVTSPGGEALPGDPLLAEALSDGALAIANEWLDVVPCPVAEVDDTGHLREVMVDTRTGQELLGASLAGSAREWVDRWWPASTPGDRVEVGVTRDRAWQSLLDRMGPGLAVALDYGHTAAHRPRKGTLAAYRSGDRVPPVPDGSCDITAHVAMDSVSHDTLQRQGDALRELGVVPPRPSYELARTDPQAYLAALSGHSAAAALSGAGLGDFLWAMARTPVPA